MFFFVFHFINQALFAQNLFQIVPQYNQGKTSDVVHKLCTFSFFIFKQ